LSFVILTWSYWLCFYKSCCVTCSEASPDSKSTWTDIGRSESKIGLTLAIASSIMLFVKLIIATYFMFSVALKISDDEVALLTLDWKIVVSAPTCKSVWYFSWHSRYWLFEGHSAIEWFWSRQLKQAFVFCVCSCRCLGVKLQNLLQDRNEVFQHRDPLFVVVALHHSDVHYIY